ncbi:MAG: hypothetical protein EXS48_01060 [Candidatus Staskawiczbacteria bacterium]|nr:hypothetical protein [Candidatus Staskawiczbacteria bacterium]
MTDEQETKFFGHWDECLRHYAEDLSSRAPPNPKKAARLRNPMTQFCKVRSANVLRWFKQIVEPTGESILRVMFFLDLVGYRVSELEAMPKYVRHFAELVVFNLLTMDEAARLIGYPTTHNLFPVLLKGKGVLREKEEMMWQAWKERKTEVEKRIEEHRKLYAQEGTPTVQAQQNGVPLSRQNLQPRHDPRNERTLIHLVNGLAELLDEISLEDFSRSAFVQEHSKDVENLAVLVTSLSTKLIFADRRKGGASG